MRKVIVLGVLLVLACSREPQKASQHLSEPGEKLYVVKGKIVGRDSADNTLKIDHQAISGYMDAMVMDYPVRGAKVQAMPADQASIEARLHVHDDVIWLTDVKKVP